MLKVLLGVCGHKRAWKFSQIRIENFHANLSLVDFAKLKPVTVQKGEDLTGLVGA
jgi:hypothetical protein